MKVTESDQIQGLRLLENEPHKDSRGLFARIYCKEEFFNSFQIAQINFCTNFNKGTIRGLHYQPRQQKIVRCLTGWALDVVVDLRRDSSTFGSVFQYHLASPHIAIWVPEMCAHGFQALTDDCELMYFSSEAYDPKAESGIRWDSPELKIPWNLCTKISDRDKGLPTWSDFLQASSSR
jgi:dTDP-4-dehydrorhamnose 3,5-epimerase